MHIGGVCAKPAGKDEALHARPPRFFHQPRAAIYIHMVQQPVPPTRLGPGQVDDRGDAIQFGPQLNGIVHAPLVGAGGEACLLQAGHQGTADKAGSASD